MALAIAGGDASQKNTRNQFFQEKLAHAFDGPAGEQMVAYQVFRPFMTSAPTTCLVIASSPSINLPADPELRMRVDRLGWALEQSVDSVAQAWGGVDKWLGRVEQRGTFAPMRIHVLSGLLTW